ncbi:MAG: CHAT domain-containing protein [Flavobacteriales bacterium]
MKTEFWSKFKKGEYDYIYQNQDYFIQALKDENSKETVAILSCIQFVSQQKGDFQNALKHEPIIYQGLITFYGYNSKEMHDHLGRISNLYTITEDYQNLIITEQTYVEVSKTVFGDQSHEHAQALLNYSVTLTDMGEYAKALELNELGLVISRRTNSKDLILQGLISEGRINFLIDRPKISERCYLEGLKSVDLDLEHFEIILSNLVGVYLKLNQLTKALEYSLKIKEFRKSNYGINSLEYANATIQYSNVLFATGQYKLGIQGYNEALEIIEDLNLEKTASYISTLNNISACYILLGQRKKAIKILSKAEILANQRYYPSHPEYLRILNNLATCFLAENNINEFKRTFILVLERGVDFYILGRFGLSWSEQTAMKLGLEEKFNVAFSIIRNENLNDNSFVQKVYLQWINFKGVVSSDNYLLNDQNKTLHDEYNKLKRLHKKYNNLIENDDISALNPGIVEVIQKEIDLSQRNLTAGIEDEITLRTVLIKDLKDNLSDKTHFVEIIQFPFYEKKQNEFVDSIQYLAFVSGNSDTIMNLVYLDKDASLEKQTQIDYQIEAHHKSTATDLKNESFYNSFWKPIAEKIGDAETLYVSLGGIYNNINLNTLYNPETGKYLIEEKDIRIVNSARDFVLSKEREKRQYTSTTSALYGFPNFNGNTTKAVDSTDFLASTRDLDQMWIDSLTRGGMKASPLPATKVEVEQIAETFQKNGWSVKTYTGENASEMNIKQEESPRVLHVATHGYFFEDIPMDKSNDRFLGMDRQRVVQDPMLRSGLLFTGANKTLQGEQVNGENGLLSAAEASLLDLRETELVVLSACETGKGEVKNSEGVYGLRKAFADAGAQNIIMSLWKVDDKVTQEFMSRFYEIWLNDKTSIREAFNRTQLEIKAKYPQPYYWGAFILVGESFY